IAQSGGGVAVPAGNINWDVPFPRALELAIRTGARVLAALPLEPVVLGALARARGLDPARDLALDTLFLGGAPLPPAPQARLAPCRCGSLRPSLTVLGRADERLDLAGRRLYPYELIDAGAAAADALASAIFFIAVLPDRVLVRIEGRQAVADPVAAFRARLPGVLVEVEEVGPNE